MFGGIGRSCRRRAARRLPALRASDGDHVTTAPAPGVRLRGGLENVLAAGAGGGRGYAAIIASLGGC